MKRALAIAALIATAAPADAHDFWIEAAPFQVPVSGLVQVSLHHGDYFMSEPVPRDPAQIVLFQMIGPDGACPVMGLSGNKTSVARPQQPGVQVIAYQSSRLPSELPGDKFDQYLREKGLAHIAELRAQRGESTHPGREVYSRCAKAIIQAGEPSAPVGAEGAPQSDRALGLPLEIVAEGNPYAMHPGSQLRVQVLFHGAPLSGAAVVALNRDDPTQRIE